MKKAGRMQFNLDGSIASIDGRPAPHALKKRKAWAAFEKRSGREEDGEEESDEPLRTSASLSFLQAETTALQNDASGWSLWSNGQRLKPLRFSNNKTQEDVVNEITQKIQEGKKMIFLQGVCGTGKSAIALNIARRLGRASIVVPVKGLQRQYEEDYASKKYLLKPHGRRMSIAMITGRENHDSVFFPGVSCADPMLPDTIKIAEKNRPKIQEYYEQNPFIKNKELPEMKQLKRIAIAPANPYWSPIVRATIELPLKDARKKGYRGLYGKEFVFYHRKQGCSYYDQYLAYLEADVIIFNAAKYKIEVALDRKPETDVDIIDECDEFLDSFSTREELNLTRLASAFSFLQPSHPEARVLVDECLKLLSLEEKNKQALGIDENRIFQIGETQLEKLLKLLLKSSELEAEITPDEINYANHALEVAYLFEELFADTYVTYRRDEEKNIIASLVTTNLSQRFHELARKTKALVLMSGTLHAPAVLRDVFGIRDFAVVEAETRAPGEMEIRRTNKEFNCKRAHFISGKYTRQHYLEALDASMEKVTLPALVHVNAFDDLPKAEEKELYGLKAVLTKEILVAQQANDKTGKQITRFKEKKIPVLYSTKCSRGVDFPGDTCNSVVFTKYPNPNVSDVFWKVLQKTHPHMYWEFYYDKARREFLQRLYRALRSPQDRVIVLSPDSRVLDAVWKIQRTLEVQHKGVSAP